MKIRTYKKGDEIDILKLDSISENHPWNRRNKANWIWKYKGPNPFGKSIVVVAEYKKKIIATFAIIPVNYSFRGKIIKASHSIAMIVHPKWQKKGIIKLVVDKALDLAKKRNIKLVYGYPNDDAYELHKVIFDYEDVGNQYFYHHDMKKIKKNEYLSKIKEVKNFTKIHKDFFNTIKKELKLMLDRNTKYLNWRYISRPDKKYYVFGSFVNKKLKGYCVLKLYKEGTVLRGHYIDIIAEHKNKFVFDELVNFGLNFFKKNKCNEVNLWLQGNNSFQKILQKNKFKRKNFRKFICKFNDKNMKKIFKKEKWFFTMGDTLEIY